MGLAKVLLSLFRSEGEPCLGFHCLCKLMARPGIPQGADPGPFVFRWMLVGPVLYAASSAARDLLLAILPSDTISLSDASTAEAWVVGSQRT